MSTSRGRPPPRATDFEQAPWTAIVPATLCGLTALVSAVILGIGAFRGLSRDVPVTFFAMPTALFAEAPWLVPVAYALIVVPWTLCVLVTARRLFFPYRDAHRTMTLLLVPAVALDVVAYAAIGIAGRPLSSAHMPFGLWLAVGAVALVLLGTRRTRRFESSENFDPALWRDVDPDDGT